MLCILFVVYNFTYNQDLIVLFKSLYHYLFPVSFATCYETILWYFNESDPTAFLVDDLKIFLVFLSFYVNNFSMLFSELKFRNVLSS